MKTEDKEFIYSSWLKSLYNGNEWFKEIEPKVYFKYYAKMIQHILSKPGVVVRCACLRDDPDVLLGYSVLEMELNELKVLHWVYVKSSWRELGIAKHLVPSSIRKVTHLTKIGRTLKRRNWKFNPFFT